MSTGEVFLCRDPEEDPAEVASEEDLAEADSEEDLVEAVSEEDLAEADSEEDLAEADSADRRHLDIGRRQDVITVCISVGDGITGRGASDVRFP